MADRDAFEKHCMGNHIGGSNPSPSVFMTEITSNEIPTALYQSLGYLAIDFACDGRQYERILLEHFAAIGFADGWADFDSDEENMEKELQRRGASGEKARYAMWLYREGYDTGKFMSDNADKIFDEDGNLNEEYDL